MSREVVLSMVAIAIHLPLTATDYQQTPLKARANAIFLAFVRICKRGK